MAESTLDDIYSYLRHFHLPSGLQLIGRLNAAILFHSLEQFRWELLSAAEARWLHRCLEAKPSIAIQWGLARLARFMLLCGSIDGVDELSVSDDTLEKALEMVLEAPFPSDEIGKTGDEFAKVHFPRMLAQQASLQGNPNHLLGRANLLFRELPTQLGINFNGPFKESSGLDLNEFMSCAFIQGVLSFGGLGKLPLTGKIIDQYLSASSIEKYQAFCSLTQSEYQQLIRSDKDPNETDSVQDLLSFDFLQSRPIVRFGSTTTGEPDSLAVPCPLYHWIAASSSILYRLSEDEIGGDEFRHEFGNIVFREYARTHLQDIDNKSGVEVIDFDKSGISVPAGVQKPDFLFIRDSEVVVVELKTCIIPAALKYLGSPDSIRNYLKSKDRLRSPVEQVSSVAGFIEDGTILIPGVQSPTVVCKLLIEYDINYMANVQVLDPISDELGQDIAAALQFGSTIEVETIGLALEEGLNVVSLLKNKCSHKLERYSSVSLSIQKALEEQSMSTINHKLAEACKRFVIEMTGNPAGKF
jgi:hypothetical protein